MNKAFSNCDFNEKNKICDIFALYSIVKVASQLLEFLDAVPTMSPICFAVVAQTQSDALDQR